MKNSAARTHFSQLIGLLFIFIGGLSTRAQDPEAIFSGKETLTEELRTDLKAKSEKKVDVSLKTAAKRAKTVKGLKERSQAKKTLAWAKAKKEKWTTRGVKPDGTEFELVDLDEEGEPVYLYTDNANAAISNAANQIRNVAPYAVNGAGWIVGVWDGGLVRTTHQEFAGGRVVNSDGTATTSSHATHVAGTVGAAGIDALAIGMAPSVTVHSYNWTSDESEMAAAAATFGGEAGKIYVSNHSYGQGAGWEYSSTLGGYQWRGTWPDAEDDFMGQYGFNARQWDQICYDAPYYLPFRSAGNERSENPTNGSTIYHSGSTSKVYNTATDPLGDGVQEGGYDSIQGDKVSKNIMTVGAVNDAVQSGVRNPSNGTVTSFTSYGPADDGRVKPDFVANGASLRSTDHGSDTAYSSKSGTSMSTPSASGAAILLHELYTESNAGEYMRASTLKALILGTSDDLGRPGPDYQYGHGLMNSKAAADLILEDAAAPNSNRIHEGSLSSANTSDSFVFTSDGSQAFEVTLSWTDPEGVSLSGTDNRTPALVNDLDLRVIRPGGQTAFPFVLDPNNPTTNATTGDNIVDNTERILIPAEAGTHTVTISHKGTLRNDLGIAAPQIYSLVVNTQIADDDFVVTPTTDVIFSGPPGGPFAPTISAFTLDNIGSASLNWSASKSATWHDLTSTSGNLSGGNNTTVSASLNSSANSLPGGNYDDVITFTNVSSGNTIDINVSLKIETPPFYTENFESGTLGTEWAVTGTGTHRTIVTQANSPFAGSWHLTMDSSVDASNARNELTLTQNLAGWTDVELEFHAKEFGDEENAPPATSFTNGADFDGVAISADGITWYEVQALRSEISAAWQQYTVDLDAAIATHGLAYNTQFKIRFNHYDNYSISTDGFAFDEIQLFGVAPPPSQSSLDLTSATDSGVSDSDNVTNLDQPVFEGVTVPLTQVTLNSDIAGVLGTATSNVSGVWSIQPSAQMANGTHSVTVTPSGGDTSPALVVVIDTQAPNLPTNIDLTAGSDSGASNSDNITNATTLNFTFSSENETSVSLYSSIANLIGSANAGSGVTVPQLADGIHQITAVASDLAGNESSATAPFALTIDTDPPAAIGIPNISAAQDTGFSDTDNITSNNNPTINGPSSTNGLVLRLRSGGVEIASTAGGGAWSIPLTNLTDGTRLVTASQTDIAGNTTTSPTMTLRIDTNAPAAPTLDLTSTSDSGSSQIDNVTNVQALQFYNSTESTAQITVTESTAGSVGSGTGSFNFTTVALAEGTHSFTSQSTDTAGNQSPLSTLNVTIDTTAPVGINAPDLVADSDTGASDSDNVTRDTTPTFTGSGNDNTSTVELLSNGTSIGTASGAGGAWNITPTVNQGTFEIGARQVDLAGNRGPTSPTITLVVDTTRPSPPTNLDLIAASDLGESDTDDLTADTTPTISGNSEADTQITLFSDNAEVGSGEGGPNFQVTASTDIGASPPSDDQQRTLHAISLDLAGNESYPSSSISIVVDNKKPTFVPFNFRLERASDSGASDTDGVTSDNTPTFSAFSSLGDVIEILADETSYARFQTIGAWTQATDPIPDGTYEMTARNSDAAGNLGTSSVVIPMTIDTTPPAAPSAMRLRTEDDSGLSDSDNITNVRLPTIQGNAEPGEIQIYQDGADQGVLTVGESGTWTFTPAANLAEGVTQFTASQIDLAGNQGIANGPFTVEVDTAAPGRPSIPVLKAASDLGAFDNDGITSDNQPAFAGTGDEGTTVLLFDENENPIGSGLHNADWQTSDPLDDGTYQIHARASDIAGNLSPKTAAVPLSIDTVAPIVTIEQGATQEDPTITHPIIFDIEFSEPIFGFEPLDVSLAGTAGAGAVPAVQSGVEGDTSFVAEVSETSGEGNVIATLPAGIAIDLAGNENLISSSTDNSVEKKLLPNPISDLTATDDTFEDKVALSWTDQSEATAGYRVFRNDFNLTHNAVEIATLPVGSTSFEDTTAPAGSWQFYWVRAEDEDGLSTFGQSDPGRTSSVSDETKRTETPLAVGSAITTSAATEWEISDAGRYDGLLLNSEDGTTLVGSATLTLKNPKATASTGGSFSGLIYHNGRRFGAKGVFDQTGYFQKDFLQRDKTILSVELQLHETDDSSSEIVKGVVTHNGTTANLDCPRMPFHKKTNPVPESVTGIYTMVMPAIEGWGETEPGGDGWASVSVATSGAIKVSGQLGDGTKLTEVAYLSAENQFSLYREFYRTKPAKGRLGGQLTISERPEQSDFDGILQWVKFADTREKTYPDGFNLAVWALGSKFVAPPKNVRVFPELADQHYNAEITFVGPTAPVESPEDEYTHRVASWFSNNRILHYGPEKLAAVVNYKNGFLKGSYYHPVTRKKIRFTGVAFQKQARTAGIFSYGGKTGAVRIKPGTDWIYPGSEDAGAVTETSAPETTATAPNLTAIAHDPAAAGIYHGVLTNASSLEFSGGIESVKFNSAGTLTGRIWIDGLLYGFKGIIDSETGAIITSINRKGGLPPIDLTLQLGLADGTTDGFQISGTVDIDGTFHSVDAQRNPHSKAAPSPHVGLYTTAVIAPESTDPTIEPAGDGYGTISVSTTGLCRGAFTLADGTKATLAGHHSRNDQWSIHRRIYSRPTGFLAGNLTFRALPNISDVDGEIRWVKLSGSRPTTLYPSGFDSQRAIVGSQFIRPTKGVSVFSSLSDDHHNAWLRIDSPDLEHPLTWAATNRISYYGPESIVFKINVKNGLVVGSYVDKANGIKIRIGGVFLEDQQLVTGFHLTGGQSHRIVIEPRGEVE